MNLQSMTFSDVVMSFLTILFFFAYLMLVFQIITDIFRDDDLHIVFKVVWIVLLLFIPVICSIVYLLIRGKGMAERQRHYHHKYSYHGYHGARKSITEQIIEAHELKVAGIITDREYTEIKEKLLR
ncbi:SHOCT domain-containing protein [Klebsiella grimontii]|uniref:SHOCT domain-containing protein n=1 Tax=Klebsiella grimontii TaxID=2058152 RepID=UPI0011584DEF|nr:SHOCT domain-containing protein [Klebsiella grimontii]